MQVNNTVYSNNGRVYYNGPSKYFNDAFDSWIEREEKGKLTDSELQELKSKYNSADMSDEENIDLLGELVGLGVFTKREASLMYFGITLLPADFVIGNSIMTECPSKQPVLKSKYENTDWLSYYQNMLAKNLENYNPEKESGSEVVNSYQEYVDILAKLAAGR